jgi:hypothetical protein
LSQRQVRTLHQFRFARPSICHAEDLGEKFYAPAMIHLPSDGNPHI